MKTQHPGRPRIGPRRQVVVAFPPGVAQFLAVVPLDHIFMTPTKVAVIFLRISGIGWLINVIIALTSLPGDLLGMVTQTGYLSMQRELALMMLLVRICLYSTAAIAFLLFTKPLAKLLTKGLDNDEA
jgi:hypothetical protein